ncbi:MAG: hypothetical protein NUW23_13960 [Firmicutes bacterium]|jgi:uncharacterized protein YqeY|nr:hypothetical protein [Bacillota bacterium]
MTVTYRLGADLALAMKLGDEPAKSVMRLTVVALKNRVVRGLLGS